MTLSGSICALARLGSPLSGGSSRHAKSTPKAPGQEAFATPQSLAETVEGGDPLGEDVAQRGWHGSFRDWRLAPSRQVHYDEVAGEADGAKDRRAATTLG